MIRPTKTLGLDLGADSLKAALVDHAYDQPVLLCTLRIPVTDTPVETLRSLKTLLPATATRIVAALHGHDVMIRIIEIDRSKLSKVDQHIHYILSQDLPSSSHDDIRIDFQIIDPDQSTQSVRILLAAAKTSRITTLIQLLDQAELSPTTIDADILALHNAFYHNSPQTTPGPIALIDIGSASTGIHLLSNGFPAASTTLPFGTAQLLHDIQQKLGVSPKHAQELTLSPHSSPTLDEALHPFCSSIATATRRTLATLQSGDIQSAHIAGGGAAIPGFLQSLGNSLQVTTVPLNPMANLYREDSTTTVSETDPAPLFALAIGLALRPA